jgi:hypothetical protein
MRSWLGTVVIILACTSPLQAQLSCADTLTITKCWDQIKEAVEKEHAAAQSQQKALKKEAEQKASLGESVETMLQAKTTGADSFGSSIASTIKDFLPFFGSFIEFASISEDGKAVTFNLNPGSNRLQLQSFVRQPELFSKLGDHFRSDVPEEVRKKTLETLQNGLDDFSDVSAVVTYNFLTAQMGRSMKVAQNRWLFERLYELAGSEAETAEAFRINNIFNVELRDLNAIDSKITQDTMLKDIDQPKLALVMDKLIAAARSRTEVALGVDKSFAALVDMVNNQNQFYITVSDRLRDELIGPGEFNVKVVYEKGFGNVAGLKKALPACFGNSDKSWAETMSPNGLSCGEEYRNKIDHWKALRDGNRFSFSAEYTHLEPYHLNRPEEGLRLDQGSSWSAIGKIAYGRYLSMNQDGQQSTRLDLSASWESVSDDPNRQDRGVASVTFTQRINDDLSIPIALIYANHSQFKGQVDKDLSAHFGLSYKLARKKTDGSK